MIIVHWGRAKQFIKAHPKAYVPLNDWKDSVQEAQWKNFSEIRESHGDVSWVKGFLVFEIKGNDFRLLALARFSLGRLYVKKVLTHAEYDKWKPR